MCIYCTTTNYRKIYENHYGKIPKDSEHRTYDIHHIDGNHSNNNPNNLKAISIQEHYDIHFSQKDYFACWMISLRMKELPNVRSQLMSAAQQKRVVEGTHHWLGGESAKKLQQELVENGTHRFLDPEFSKKHNRQKVENGTHHFLGGEIQRNRVSNGTHPFLGGEIQKATTAKRIAEGTHHMLGRKEIACPHCGTIGHKPIMARWHFDNCKSKV